MAIGDIHHYDQDRTYVETLHGPNIETVCCNCGKRAHSTPEVAAANDAWCSGCLIVKHGARHGAARIIGAPRGAWEKIKGREGPGLAESRKDEPLTPSPGG